jgi:hypothetical protein
MAPRRRAGAANGARTAGARLSARKGPPRNRSKRGEQQGQGLVCRFHAYRAAPRAAPGHDTLARVPRSARRAHSGSLKATDDSAGNGFALLSTSTRCLCDKYPCAGAQASAPAASL